MTESRSADRGLLRQLEDGYNALARQIREELAEVRRQVEEERRARRRIARELERVRDDLGRVQVELELQSKAAPVPILDPEESWG